MPRYGSTIAAILACFFILFLLVKARDVPLLTDPAPGWNAVATVDPDASLTRIDTPIVAERGECYPWLRLEVLR